MKNELSKFRTVIEQCIQDSTQLIDSEESIRIVQSIDQAGNQLINRFEEVLFSDCDDQYLSRILNISHIKLTDLFNQYYVKIKHLFNKDSSSLHEVSSTEEVCKYVVQSIDGLVNSAYALFADYAGQDIPLSLYTIDLKGQQLLLEFSPLEKRIKKIIPSQGMAEALHDFFNEFDSAKRVRVSHRQLDYSFMLLREIRSLIQKERGEHLAPMLWKLLVHWNFNSDRMMQYAKQYIYVNAIMDKSYDQAVLALNFIHKEVSQVMVNVDWYYNPKQITLKARVEDLITEELSWMEKNQEELEKALAQNHENFFILDITVKQLNLLVDLCVSLKRIPYHSTSQVLKVLTMFIRTVNAGAISYESARKKIRDIDATTVKGLYVFIRELQEGLENNYHDLLHS